MLLGLLPSWWSRAALALLALGAVWGHGWFTGAGHVQAEWDQQVAAQGVIQTQIAVRQGEVTERVVTQYADRVRTITVKGKEVIRAIPQFIPVDSCAAPAGERLLLDAAASGGPVPDAARIADAAPASAQDVTASVTANYEACRLNAEQLTALQGWILQQQQASK